MKNRLITRYEKNPILTANDVSFESSLVFNAGVVKVDNKYIMAFRSDSKISKEMFENWAKGVGKLNGPTCQIGLAYSDDGFSWKACNNIILNGEKLSKITGENVINSYDPRLMVLDNEIYMSCASTVSTMEERCCLLKTKDFSDFELVTYTLPNNRNMLIFPEKIGEYYYRLERPFINNVGDIWISRSPDLKFWGESKRLLNQEQLSFCNSKIGPGAPPVRTEKGWLVLFHTVTVLDEKLLAWENPYSQWNKKYTFGLMLLDLDDPSKIIGIHNQALLEPEEEYELDGFRGSVLFPGAMIIEDDRSMKIYYGAADTVECVATANLDEILALF